MQANGAVLVESPDPAHMNVHLAFEECVDRAKSTGSRCCVSEPSGSSSKLPGVGLDDIREALEFAAANLEDQAAGIHFAA